MQWPVFAQRNCKCVVTLLAVTSIAFFCKRVYTRKVNTQLSINRTSPSEIDFTKGLTFQCSSGQLGNRMYFYAVVYGLSRLNNRSGYIQKCNLNTCTGGEKNCAIDQLDEVFELSLPIGPDLSVENQRGHAIEFHLRFPEDYQISPDDNILVGELWPCSVTHFLHVKEEIRREFRFRKLFQKHAKSFLELARGSRQNVTLVGVHVRRGDYISFLAKRGLPLVPRKFFKYALAYFRKLFPSVLFVVLSDDVDWCQKNIVGDDVYFASNMSSPGQDLAVLSNCHHVVFDYGTYGFWGALLAGGKAMYYVDGITRSTYYGLHISKKTYPPEWIGVSNTMMEFLK